MDKTENNKTTLAVTIFNKNLEINCSGEDTAYLEELSSYVDKIIKDIYLKQPTKSDATVVILACLNLADALKREMAKNESSVEFLNDFTSRLISIIETVE